MVCYYLIVDKYVYVFMYCIDVYKFYVKCMFIYK